MWVFAKQRSTTAASSSNSQYSMEIFTTSNEDSNKYIFEVPDGTMLQASIEKFRCLSCGRESEQKIFLI